MSAKGHSVNEAHVGARSDSNHSGHPQPEAPFPHAKVTRPPPLSAGGSTESLRGRDARVEYPSRETFETPVRVYPFRDCCCSLTDITLQSRYPARAPEDTYRNPPPKNIPGTYRRPVGPEHEPMVCGFQLA